MKKFATLLLAVMAVGGSTARAQHPTDDPIHALLFPPDILLRHHEDIGLSAAQVAQIQARVQEAGPQAQAKQKRVHQALGQLAELLAAVDVDEEAAFKQLDEVLAIEKELKRFHLRLMIQVRNELTAEQRQAAAKIKRKTQPHHESLQQRLQAKLARIEREVQSRAEQGQPPFDAVGAMQKFPELMQNGQVRQAEALLDRVIQMLGLEQDGDKTNEPADLPENLAKKIRQVQQRAQKMLEAGKDVSKIKELMDQLPPLIQNGKTEEAEKLLDEALKLTSVSAAFDRAKLRSLADVRTAADALRKEDVAWRGIAWKTCLLNGLKASREQKKPIMLWVFIDRPIDDERC